MKILCQATQLNQVLKIHTQVMDRKFMEKPHVGSAFLLQYWQNELLLFLVEVERSVLGIKTVRL